MSRSSEKLITIGVPEDAHRQMKAAADARGMKLREYQRFLVKLAGLATAKQQRLAYDQYVAERSGEFAPDATPEPVAAGA